MKADLGERDAKYIRSMIALQRRLALIGRAELIASRWRIPGCGASTLGLAKILENMEIGHNVLHGQWDWMNDPVINSRAWDWDTASTAEAWRHSHNYIHHTLHEHLRRQGQGSRLRDHADRSEPIVAPGLSAPAALQHPAGVAVQWGVAFHDMDFEAVRSGEKSMKEVRKDLKGIATKARLQIQKDYIAWPLISALVMTGIEFAVFGVREQAEMRSKSPKVQARRAARRLQRTPASSGRTSSATSSSESRSGSPSSAPSRRTSSPT